ncbi:BZ3500_MvSof-1268-A1-R1_Chr9g10530 [Microbotryum saponariae]|uniref:BZ3500_MvSof-1268-A1-R1_Chr9g10530 protein n=1 Tax=Microbotryum saponariae TaxID=289078 RepID=A0A2X0KDR0_9BASI|nr:BZ3501_MvSof-1269-A2-R1_Chr9g10279 [Microbotryum saponariae]SDA00246.1 BZ3500_MvSof-1268-A1-R1_Chr9g10530 [Microbotryum saponariae]
MQDTSSKPDAAAMTAQITSRPTGSSLESSPSQSQVRVGERTGTGTGTGTGTCDSGDTATLAEPPISPPSIKERLRIAVVWIGQTMLHQWFLIGIGVVIALAHSFPNVGREGGIVHAQWSVNYLLVAIIFFVSGLSLPLHNIVKRSRDYKLHLVTQAYSFLFFPTVVYAIVNIVRAADPTYTRINEWALVGMVVMGCVPTTVVSITEALSQRGASNVVMTGQAGGDESAATIEVIFGNTIGVFLTPALLSAFMSGPWAFGAPRASGSGGTADIYLKVLKQVSIFSIVPLGFTVFIPLVVGEVLQSTFTHQVQWIRAHCHLAKLSSLCLLGVIWSTFSGAFYENVFTKITGGTVAFIVLVDSESIPIFLGLFALHALLLMLLARHTPFLHLTHSTKSRFLPTFSTSSPHETLFDPSTTIALIFLGSAKGVSLGGPIASILYGAESAEHQSLVKLPLVLYQGSQVALGQGLVVILRAWKRRIDRRDAVALAGEKNVDVEVVASKGGEKDLESSR